VTLLGQWVGLDGPQGSLPTPTILWFCGSPLSTTARLGSRTNTAVGPQETPRDSERGCYASTCLMRIHSRYRQARGTGGTERRNLKHLGERWFFLAEAPHADGNEANHSAALPRSASAGLTRSGCNTSLTVLAGPARRAAAGPGDRVAVPVVPAAAAQLAGWAKPARWTHCKAQTD